MKKELELILVRKYPNLCQDYEKSEMETCFHYGFECQDGWFNLIDNTLDRIDKIIKENDLSVKIAQIKSKFGRLVIYIDIESGPRGAKVQQAIHKINSIIDIAYDQSSKISEISGNPASQKVINGWVYTITDEEYEKIINSKNEI